MVLILIVGCEGTNYSTSSKTNYSTSPEMKVAQAEQDLADFTRKSLNEGYWYNEEKNLEDAVKDCQECLFEAKKATVNVYSLHKQALNEVSLLIDCMKIRGYKQLLQQNVPTELRTKRIDYVGVAGK